jgi:flagellar operon protein
MTHGIINGKSYQIKKLPENSMQNKADNFVNNKSAKKNKFNDILNTEIEKQKNFKISNHAVQRMNQRNIQFNVEDVKKINEGINKAKEKGANDCLILYKDLALITSIKNRTIITAVDKKSSKENVFTNIDSVVLL